MVNVLIERAQILRGFGPDRIEFFSSSLGHDPYTGDPITLETRVSHGTAEGFLETRFPGVAYSTISR